MSLKRVPNPNIDSNQWGKILYEHLSQTKNPINAGFNRFTKIY